MPVVDFDPLQIEYDERVLAPRPWTRMQSEWAAEIALRAPDGPVLELCSGAGHIGLEAARLSGRALVCVDQNPAA
ncbi:MAG: methyltransferase, partial [Propionibacterium sp.]|nr:methyltransferase [Propionibacterium sp.]